MAARQHRESQPLAELHQRVHALLTDLSALGTTESAKSSGKVKTVLEQLTLLDEEVATQSAQLVAARDELERERVRYLDLFELAPDPYLLTDVNGLIGEANSAAASLFGIERRFLLGKPLQVFVPEADRHEFRRRVAEIEATDRPVEWRLCMEPRGSARRHISATVAPMRLTRGAMQGLRWALRDVSERVHEEEQLRNLNAELERRVDERTHDLEMANRAKDDLLERERRARESAEAANRAKDEFLATLSHELRTPLNVVLGLIFRLSGSPAMAHEQKTIDTIGRNARELSHLVEDLLDTARISSGRLSLHKRVVDVSTVTRDAVDSLVGSAEARSIRIRTELAPELEVEADAERLRQIAWNLISNAVKFTPAGGAVTVRTIADDTWATMIVTDTGIGISTHVMPHIFRRFWQGEPSTGRRPGGLGLGLSIVKDLVEMHGGTIKASSAGHELGSTFTVRLPLFAATHNASGQRKAAN